MQQRTCGFDIAEKDGARDLSSPNDQLFVKAASGLAIDDNFIIVACAIFMGVKAINRLKREEAVAPKLPPVPTKEEDLLGEIRDLLKAQNNQP